MIAIPDRKRGKPKKWNGESVKQYLYLGAEDLAVIHKAFKLTKEVSFNAFLVNTILDRAAEIEAAEMRKTYSESSERVGNPAA